MSDNVVREFPAESRVAPQILSETRPLYWSIRRELWENRSIYIAPLIVEAIVLFGFLFSTITLPHRLSAVAAQSAARQREVISMPYSALAGMAIFTAFFVGVFYCLDALHGERRDRSILFWKSLPVSDRTTVLAKACIPLVVMPLLNFAVIVTAQLIMLFLNTVRLLPHPQALAMLWSHMKFVQMTLALLYGLIAIALWHAPIYAWLLLVSGWSRRAAILWAVLPFLALGAAEKIVFNSSHVMSALGYRVAGWLSRAFVFPPKGTVVAVDPLAHLTPGKFLSTPSLWLGLLFAVVFLAAAVRLRRNREPI